MKSLAIGAPKPVDLSILERCHDYVNGHTFSLPGGRVVGVIAPGDVPDETGLRVSIRLPAHTSVTFRSRTFEVHSKELKKPLTDTARLVLLGALKPPENVQATFVENGILKNATDKAQTFLLRVFSISDLPRQFILRPPEIKVLLVWFRVQDFAYKFFPHRNAYGLCTAG